VIFGNLTNINIILKKNQTRACHASVLEVCSGNQKPPFVVELESSW
jgi:hypothetical protein